jgi:hypothetical protein
MARISRLIAGVVLMLTLGMTPGAGAGAATVARADATCAELVVNGGFETVGAWQLGASPSPPQYTNVNKHSGAYSLSLGISDGVNRQSFSSARQAVTIPTGIQSAMLSFWFYASATGAPTTDYMELVILAPDGAVLDKPWFSRNDSQVWNPMTFDLTAWQGRTVQLYFNVYNDGLGGMAQMYLDDVSFAACAGGGAGWVTPALTPATPGGATGTPGAGTATPTRGACPKPSLNCTVPTPKATSTATPAVAPSAAPATVQSAPTFEAPAIITTSPQAAAPAIITAAVAEASQPETLLPAMEMPAIIEAPAASAPAREAAPAVLADPGDWTDPVVNGGFEQNFIGWSTAGDAPAPLIVTDGVRGGLRAAQLGALEGVPEGLSSIYQEITVPAGYSGLAVDFWVYPWAGEGAGSDYQEVKLISPDGATATQLWHTQSNTRVWTRQTIPVTGFTGDPLRLQFTVYNDGVGGSTGMVIDDVSLLALGLAADPQDGSRSGGVALPQPNETRLALVITVTPPPGATPAATRVIAPSPTVTATATPAAKPRITDKWPKNWWLIPVGAVLIILLLWWLARRNNK